jgi:PKD repeat protein
MMNVDTSNNILSQTGFLDNPLGPVDIKTGIDGYLYYLAIYTGEVKRIIYTSGNRQPIAISTTTPDAGITPLTVSFSASGSSDPDGDALSYEWNFGDGFSSTGITTTHTYITNGLYDAILTVRDGQ